MLTINMQADQLSQNIKTRFDHQQARIVLRETYQAKMLFAHSNGMWKASPDLIVLCDCCKDSRVVLEDYYNTPVSVDPLELKQLAIQRWQEQMNAWQAEYNEISKQR
jgi:hypothetical protein